MPKGIYLGARIDNFDDRLPTGGIEATCDRCGVALWIALKSAAFACSCDAILCNKCAIAKMDGADEVEFRPIPEEARDG